MQPLEQLPFVAGHPALDFVNTAELRGHPDAGDVLRTPTDLRAWGARYGMVARSATSEDEDRELTEARHARELLYDLLLRRVEGRTAPHEELDRLRALAAEAYAAGQLVAEGGRLEWRWGRAALATVRHVAVTSGVALLGAEPAGRLKQCPGDHCGWFFLDETKRGNRRWCSMSECGQDAKTERRRAQRSSTTALRAGRAPPGGGGR